MKARLSGGPFSFVQGMDEDLDALIRQADPDRWLSSRFIADVDARADVVALYAFDNELARAPKVASNPLMGEIRLTWWSEAIGEVFERRPVRRHPVTLALEAAAGRRKLARQPFDAMIDARFENLEARPLGPVMRIAAAMLGSPEAQIVNAAEALVDRDPKLLKDANHDLADLPAAAFPAVAYATLVRAKDPSELEKRFRLAWAVLRGRL